MASSKFKEMPEREAAEILSTFPNLEYETVFKTLQEYQTNSTERKQSALRKIFQQSDTTEPAELRESDIRKLEKLFPQFTRKEIRGYVVVIGNEPNRCSIVSRLLLKKLLRRNKKRRIPEPEPVRPPKALRLDVAQTAGPSTATSEPPTDDSSALNSVDEAQSFDELPSFLEFMNDEPVTNSEVETSGTSDETLRTVEETVAEPETSMEASSVDISGTVEEERPMENNVAANEVVPVGVWNERGQNIVTVDLENEQEGAVGGDPSIDTSLYYRLAEIFPDARPDYIRGICADRTFSVSTVDELITKILSEPNYPKRTPQQQGPEEQADVDEQYEMLMQMLPDADPQYLRSKCNQLAGNNEALMQFISSALEHKDYPTMKEYMRKMQLSAQEKQYTTDFSVENFLNVIPDPVAFFEDPKRTTAYTYDSHGYVYEFLKNKYNQLQITKINKLCNDYRVVSKMNLITVCQRLDAIVKTGDLMKTKRKAKEWVGSIQNIPLLQEIAYITHKEEILAYIKQKKEAEREERVRAKAMGSLFTCNCCYDEEVLERETAKCENGCVFCVSCVEKSVEVAFGEGKLQFECLLGCSADFSLQTLQTVLKPKLFSAVARKKQLDEVKAAGIEDLEMCPFCDFATIPAVGDKLFKCLNPDCMKESCRNCKEPSHVPLRCDEVEKDDCVKARTYIENKMTEALIKRCYKCNMKFIKLDGCNKITCSCGARMCYVCGKPVSDYKHFNGLGGDQHHLCPLYSDTHKMHKEAVLKGAEEAKNELGVKEDPKKLKHDPTVDLDAHYKEMAAKHPVNPAIANAANNVAALDRLWMVQQQLQAPRNHHRQHHRQNQHP